MLHDPGHHGAYAISENYLRKVIHQLQVKDFVGTVSGKSSGVALVRETAAISVGDIACKMEPEL